MVWSLTARGRCRSVAGTIVVDDRVAARNRWRVWLLAWVPDVRFGRWLTAFVSFVLLYGAFRLSRVFEEADHAGQAAALFFSIIIAYIVPAYHLITERTLAAFDELEPELVADREQIARWRDRIARKTPLWTWSTLGLGALMGLGHNILLAGTPTAMLQQMASSIPAVSLVIGTQLVWIVMMFVVVALLDNARLFYRLASHTRIDLIDPRRLTAFARVAVASTLALIGAQAAFPVLWTSPDNSAVAMIPGLLSTTIPMLFLLALPIWPIHRAIAAAKANELKRINTRLRSIPDNGDESAHLTSMNQLLIYRREIAGVNEWPFNTGVATRLAFYLIIPPLTWVAAGLIDVLIERLV
jgi:hypothetical protein